MPGRCRAEARPAVIPGQPELLEVPGPGGDGPAVTVPDLARSPAQIAWLRFRRDRVGVVSGFVVGFFLLVALAAPLISWAYGRDPYTTYGQDEPGLLTPGGLPVGPFGGISSRFWLGLEPGLGRDVFMQLVYGARTSLFIAFTVALVTSVVGAPSASSPATSAAGWTPPAAGSSTSSSRSPACC